MTVTFRSQEPPHKREKPVELREEPPRNNQPLPYVGLPPFSSFDSAESFQYIDGIMVVELDMERRPLAKREGGAGLVPEQAAVGRDMGTADAAEDERLSVQLQGIRHADVAAL